VSARLVFIASTALALAACHTPPKPTYHWGKYPAATYEHYSTPGKVSPEQEIETLKAEVERAAASNQPAPPGLHAHLGYLYLESGKSNLAVQELETEKKLFPESAKFVDSLLQRLKGAPKR
jgi:hypothetical protein